VTHPITSLPVLISITPSSLCTVVLPLSCLRPRRGLRETVHGLREGAGG